MLCLSMEALLRGSTLPSSSSFSSSYLLPLLPKPSFMIPNALKLNYNNPCFIFVNGYPSFSSSLPFSVSMKPRKSASVVVSARKKDKKEDSHSFVPKPEEATGFFPEAVLLKKKTVEEDGQVRPAFADVEERQLFEALMLELESDLNVDQMRHYEVVYLIHEKHEQEVTAVNDKVQDFLREKKGRVWRLNDWGMRRLAYKIKKANNARYILMNLELDAKYINEFKTLLDKDERVIRHLVIKRDEAITEDCPPPPEFNSLRADADDYDDEEEYDEDYADADDDDDDWDVEAEMDGGGDDDDFGEEIIVIDGKDDDGRDHKNDISANVR